MKLSMMMKFYLLELEGGKFYVGQSNDPDARFELHLAGKGANWTRLYKPVGIIKVDEFAVRNAAEAILFENWLTLQAMERFGWENVRGGEYLASDGFLLRDRLSPIYDCNENKIRYFVAENRHLLFGKSEDWLIYVLELCDGHFYIGSCKHLGKSLGSHFDGTSNCWTQKYPVIKVLEVYILEPGVFNYLDFKHKLLLDYISRHGWENVMGGSMPKKDCKAPGVAAASSAGDIAEDPVTA